MWNEHFASSVSKFCGWTVTSVNFSLYLLLHIWFFVFQAKPSNLKVPECIQAPCTSITVSVFVNARHCLEVGLTMPWIPKLGSGNSGNSQKQGDERRQSSTQRLGGIWDWDLSGRMRRKGSLFTSLQDGRSKGSNRMYLKSEKFILKFKRDIGWRWTQLTRNRFWSVLKCIPDAQSLDLLPWQNKSRIRKQSLK